MKTFLSAQKKPFWHLFTASLFVLLILVLSTTGRVEAERYDVPHNRKISDILPDDKIKGEHYKIHNEVIYKGFMNTFKVDSDYGEFEVTGNGALYKLLKEIHAITVLKEIGKTEAFTEALADAAKKPFEFAGGLVTKPVETVSSVPKGVAGIFQGAYAGLTTKSQAGEDSQVESLLLSKYKREYAYNLGVDVYSSNAALQAELDRIGWAAAVGSLSFSAATAPIGGGAGMAISYTGLAQDINNYLKDQPPSKIRSDAKKKLAEMGVDEDLVKKFLENPNYTPRHTTVIVANLMKLEGAQGRDIFITHALSATDEESANFIQNIIETIRGYHETVSPIKEIMMNSNMVLARSKEDTILIPFPLDYGIWTENDEKLFTNIINTNKEELGPDVKFDIWITGTGSPLALKTLEERGVKVAEKVYERTDFVDFPSPVKAKMQEQEAMKNQG
jgi:hypothetical protein